MTLHSKIKRKILRKQRKIFRQSYERNFGVIKGKNIVNFLMMYFKFKLNNCIVMIKIEVTQKSSNLRLIAVSFTTNILL